MKKMFNKGDVVICIKFDIEQKTMIDNFGIRSEPYIEDQWFNRRAYISDVDENENKYKITFLDNGYTLAWVNEEELVMLLLSKGSIRIL